MKLVYVLPTCVLVSQPLISLSNLSHLASNKGVKGGNGTDEHSKGDRDRRNEGRNAKRTINEAGGLQERIHQLTEENKALLVGNSELNTTKTELKESKAREIVLNDIIESKNTEIDALKAENEHQTELLTKNVKILTSRLPQNVMTDGKAMMPYLGFSR